jgi:hypothetical protein
MKTFQVLAAIVLIWLAVYGVFRGSGVIDFIPRHFKYTLHYDYLGPDGVWIAPKSAISPKLSPSLYSVIDLGFAWPMRLEERLGRWFFVPFILFLWPLIIRRPSRIPRLGFAILTVASLFLSAFLFVYMYLEH